MKLLPLLLGVALLVLITETVETESEMEQKVEDFFQAKGSTEKGTGIWDKIKALGKTFKEKAKSYVRKVLGKLENSLS